MSSTVVDAGVLISFLRSSDAHHADATDAIVKLVGAGESVVVSTVTLSEVLVGPSRAGASAVALALDKIRQIGVVEIKPVTEVTARLAALARARNPTLKTPDAMVVATAQESRAGRILTTDSNFRGVNGAARLSDFARSRD